MLKNKLKIHFGKISIILLAVCVALVAVDLLTKFFEEKYSWNFIVIPNFIEVESGIRNSGAAFSFLAESAWGQAFLISLSSVMAVALIAVFLFLPDKFVILKVAIAMVVAGAVGNLVDRIMFREVRDFVWMNLFGNFACCNFADFWIVLGAILAAMDLLFFNEYAVIPLTKKAKAAQKEREERAKEQAEDDGNSGSHDGE